MGFSLRSEQRVMFCDFCPIDVPATELLPLEGGGVVCELCASEMEDEMGRRKTDDDINSELQQAEDAQRNRIVQRVEKKALKALVILIEANNLLSLLAETDRHHIETLDMAVKTALKELDEWDQYKQASRNGILY